MITIPEMLASPLAMHPVAATALLEKYRLEVLQARPPAQSSIGGGGVSEYKPYEMVAGIALIPVNGTLVHEESYYYDEMSYGSIAGKIAGALSDKDVRGLALIVNSPGGMVSGCFDFCDAMFGLRGGKPMWAIVDESAYSAAYAIASSADRIIVPRTGGVGSVGVITMHIDITKMLDDFGVKVTTIQFGDRKSDSYPTTPLSDEARERMQADIDVLGGMFVDMVARNRGIKVSAVRGTQAGCFLGEDGVTVGLADAVMPAQQAIMEFIDYVK